MSDKNVFVLKGGLTCFILAHHGYATRGMDPSAPSPPMKSTVTRFRCCLRLTLGLRPTVTNPPCESGSVKVDALTAINLCLTIEGQMISVFADQNMRHCGLSRYAAWDQARWCRRLHHTIGAGPAGIFRAARDNHTELRRNDVEAFADVLTDHMPFSAAAAGHAIGRNRFFNTQ